MNLYIDLLGPYPRSKRGKTQILIILDHLTKFAVLRPLPSPSASKSIKQLREHVFDLFGVPEYVHSDNGTQFVSKEFKSFLECSNVKHIRTAFYSPQ